MADSEKAMPTTTAAATDGRESPATDAGVKAKDQWVEDHSSRAHLAAQFTAWERGLTTWQAARIYWRTVLWVIYAELAIFGYGIDGVIAGYLTGIPKFTETYGTPYSEGTVTYIISATWLSIWSGVTQITAIIGALAAGYLADLIGRKYTNLIFCLISIAAVGAQYASTRDGSMPILTAGKAINGFSIGAWIVIAPLYASEVSPLPLRGIMTAATNFIMFCGLLLFNGIMYVLAPMDTDLAYKVPLALQWIMPVFLASTIVLFPESPVWLIRFGKKERGLKAMKKLYGENSGVDLDGLVAQIEEDIEHEKRESHQTTDNRGYFEVFKKEHRKRTLIAVMAFTFVQASGNIFVLGYQSYFYQLIGYSARKSFLITVLVNVIMFIATISSWWGITVLGRRTLYVWGELITAICLFAIGGASVAGTVDAYKAVVGFIFVWAFAYQFTVGTVGFPLLLEVPALRMRARTQAVANIAMSVTQWVIGFTFPYLFNPDAANLSGKVGFIYAGLTVLGFLFSFWFLPETKNRSVAELDALFASGVAPRNFSSYVVDFDEENDNAAIVRKKD
ncbi:Plasma membrane low glucose sensor [Sporothrix stenoceras]|uniref:Plasma membrane low glucose sensor n=1 Tax=Sporothrix stenoceras TaxID=5173 RepID=A0ABR3YJ89_9PEZI